MGLIKENSAFVLTIILLCFAAGGCSIIDFLTKTNQREEDQSKKAEPESRPKTFEMTRLNPDGSIDLSFGNDGKVIVDPDLIPEGEKSVFQEVRVLKDDKIALRYGSDIFLFNANGSRKEELKFKLGRDSDFHGLSYAPQAKKFLFAVSHPEYSEVDKEGYPIDPRERISLFRFTTDGEKDLSFGKDGEFITAVGSTSDTTPLAVLRDEKILLAGTLKERSLLSLRVLRLEKNGRLDLSFGNEGIMSGNEHSRPKQIILQKDGKFIVVDDGNTLYRYKANGTPDRSFGKDGVLETDVKQNNCVRAVVQDSKENLIVGGWTNDHYVLRRYDRNGAADVNFNHGEQLDIEPSELSERLQWGYIWESALPQIDGKIIVAIRLPCVPACHDVFDLDATFAMKRYNANGTIDNGFGNEGKVLITGSLKQIFLLPNQKILVAGRLVEMQNK